MLGIWRSIPTANSWSTACAFGFISGWPTVGAKLTVIRWKIRNNIVSYWRLSVTCTLNGCVILPVYLFLVFKRLFRAVQSSDDLCILCSTLFRCLSEATEITRATPWPTSWLKTEQREWLCIPSIEATKSFQFLAIVFMHRRLLYERQNISVLLGVRSSLTFLK